MPSPQPQAGEQAVLIVVGASVRAAAFSALRAGILPWCADLFADADLCRRCRVERIPPAVYPQGFAAAVARGPAVPWLYTGGLENWPSLIASMSRARPLWGNGPRELNAVRSPTTVARLMHAQGLPHPDVRPLGTRLPERGRWLVKPRRGAGGAGIHFWDGRKRPSTHSYLQEYVEGETAAALYVGGASRTRLLGVTRQLVGDTWLHASPFQYCGSIGPMPLTPRLARRFRRLGEVLRARCGLRGLFGVDVIMRDAAPWPVEINPRYVASAEVLEHAMGVRTLGLHRQVFDPASKAPQSGGAASGGVVGKAVLFAQAPVTFPTCGPWEADLECPVHDLPAHADIPTAGTRIASGRPVLTIFARAASVVACINDLRRKAEELDRRLFQG